MAKKTKAHLVFAFGLITVFGLSAHAADSTPYLQKELKEACSKDEIKDDVSLDAFFAKSDFEPGYVSHSVLLSRLPDLDKNKADLDEDKTLSLHVAATAHLEEGNYEFSRKKERPADVPNEFYVISRVELHSDYRIFASAGKLADWEAIDSTHFYWTVESKESNSNKQLSKKDDADCGSRTVIQLSPNRRVSLLLSFAEEKKLGSAIEKLLDEETGSPTSAISATYHDRDALKREIYEGLKTYFAGSLSHKVRPTDFSDEKFSQLQIRMQQDDELTNGITNVLIHLIYRGMTEQV